MLRSVLIWIVMLGNLLGGVFALAMGVTRWREESTHRLDLRRFFFGGGPFATDHAWNLIVTAALLIGCGVAILLLFLIPNA
jgi:chemotaxis signal transduction protein